jgi:hypothetical protein
MRDMRLFVRGLGSALAGAASSIALLSAALLACDALSAKVGGSGAADSSPRAGSGAAHQLRADEGRGHRRRRARVALGQPLLVRDRRQRSEEP